MSFMGFVQAKQFLGSHKSAHPISPTNIISKGMAKEPEIIFAKTFVSLSYSKVDLEAAVFTL